MNWESLTPYAESVLSLLAPACTRIAIAGSLRRQKPGDCKDIELVAQPKMETRAEGLFGEVSEVSALDPLLEALTESGALRWQLQDNGNRAGDGQFYKKLRCAESGYPIDLFLARPDGSNFGAVFTIRTGDAEFSHWLVTNREKGGAMPYGMRQAEGYLWRKTGSEFQHFPDGYERIPCFEEEAYFNAIGVDWIPPQNRSAAAIPRLRANLREGVTA